MAVIIGADASYRRDTGVGGWCWAASDGRVLCQTVTDMQHPMESSDLEAFAVMDASKANAVLSCSILTDSQSISDEISRLTESRLARTKSPLINWILNDTYNAIEHARGLGSSHTVSWLEGHRTDRAGQVEYCLHSVADQVSRRMSANTDHADQSAWFDADRLYEKCADLNHIIPVLEILPTVSAEEWVKEAGLVGRDEVGAEPLVHNAFSGMAELLLAKLA